jgi:hypothetical protein
MKCRRRFSPHMTTQENPILEKERQAEEILTALDTYANTHPEKGEELRERVLSTAKTFADCVIESTVLAEEAMHPGSEWHEKEAAAHTAFLETLRDFSDNIHANTDIRINIPDDRLHTNALALHIAQHTEEYS